MPHVLVTSAGTGAGNNFVRSLAFADPAIVAVGCHDDPFTLKASAASRNYLVPPPTHPAYPGALAHVIAGADIDLVVPMSDLDVEVIGRHRQRFGGRTFLPAPSVLALCRDKYVLARHLAAHEIPVPVTLPVVDLQRIGRLMRRLPRRARYWCRMRTGAGSMGATPVATVAQARHWIAYWRDLRGVAPNAFTVAEYLPGRDFACQSLWRDGRLVLIKTVERLSYYSGWSRPSGVSSIAALAKTVRAPQVVDICVRAIQAVSPSPTGAFSVDLKENSAGVPCVTEINAGRFITMLSLFDQAGKHNMSATYLRLALGEPLDIRDEYDVADDVYLIRDVDRLPGIFHANEVFAGIADARWPRLATGRKGDHHGRNQGGAEELRPPRHNRAEIESKG